MASAVADGTDRRVRGQPSPVHSAALVAICLGYFMTILDTTIVNVALPAIARGLGATVTGLQWVVDGYTLVFAALLLTAGALGDRLGGRGVFLAGLALFTVTSALCGLAPSLGLLVAFRVAQGVGAALLVPASLALLRHTFAAPEARARAIGFWGGIAGVGAASGPVLGGLLVSALSWRAVFLVNVPVGLLGIALTLRHVGVMPRQSGRGLDPIAQVAGALALGGLTFAFIEGPARGWTAPAILGAVVVFVVAAATFLAVEWRGRNPMLPLSLFRAPSFASGTAVGLLTNFGFYGQLFVISLFFQQQRGYTALLTGLALLPETGMATIGSALAGRVTSRVGPRRPMLIGLVVGAAGLFALAVVGPATPYAILVVPLVASGFGMCFTMPAMTTAVIEAAPRDRAGIASGVLNAARQTGSVLGVALLGAFVGRHGTVAPGLHVAMAVAGGAFLVGCTLTLRVA